MSEPRIVVHAAEGGGLNLWLWCPGCLEVHRVCVSDDEGRVQPGPEWDWDRNVTAPTIAPSILLRGGRNGSDHVCHSFVRAGIWDFLPDSTHSLSGQQFEMGDLPVWLRKMIRP